MSHSFLPSPPSSHPDLQLSPVQSLVLDATAVSCGVDFTIWIAGGKAMGAGSPQFGQLGDGSDHAYNAKDSSICMVNIIFKYSNLNVLCLSSFPVFDRGCIHGCRSRTLPVPLQVYDPQATPKMVKGALVDKTVARIACGHNHCIAVDTEGAAYSWGTGGYGRLGHKVRYCHRIASVLPH